MRNMFGTLPEVLFGGVRPGKPPRLIVRAREQMRPDSKQNVTYLAEG